MSLPSVDAILHSGEWAVPRPHDHRAFTYVAAGAANDDNIATIVFRIGGVDGTVVATYTLTYVGATNNVATLALTFP